MEFKSNIKKSCLAQRENCIIFTWLPVQEQALTHRSCTWFMLDLNIHIPVLPQPEREYVFPDDFSYGW